MFLKQLRLYIYFKVVIVGNGAVGKSSMIQRYCRGTFTRDYKKTIGVDFLERQIEYVILRRKLLHLNSQQLLIIIFYIPFNIT